MIKKQRPATAISKAQDPVATAIKDISGLSSTNYLKAALQTPATSSYSWNPDRVQQAIVSHDVGQFHLTGYMIESMRSDNAIRAALQARTIAVIDKEIRVVGGSKTARLCLQENISKILPQYLINQILSDSILIGFQVNQLTSRYDSEQRINIPELEPWHPAFTWYSVSERKHYATAMNGIHEIVPGDGQWVCAYPYGIYRGYIHALCRPLAPLWLQHSYSMRDWGRYNEKHGLPITVLYIPTQLQASMKQEFVSAMANLASESVVPLPQGEGGIGVKVELLEPKDSSFESFENSMAWCAKRIAITILNQNLTTDVDAGSLAAANVHDRVRQEIVKSDAKLIADVVNDQVLPYWAEDNWGSRKAAPKIEFVFPEKQETSDAQS